MRDPICVSITQEHCSRMLKSLIEEGLMTSEVHEPGDSSGFSRLDARWLEYISEAEKIEVALLTSKR